MASQAHSIEFRVRYAETDQMQVVYHANYLVWCEMGRTEFIRHVWAPYAELERAGIGLAVVDAHLTFHSAARYDNLIRVTATLREIKSRTVTFDYLIADAETGQRYVTATTTLVGFTSSGKVTSLPTDLRRALEAVVSGA